jgi:hypothetical protein
MHFWISGIAQILAEILPAHRSPASADRSRGARSRGKQPIEALFCSGWCVKVAVAETENSLACRPRHQPVTRLDAEGAALLE